MKAEQGTWQRFRITNLLRRLMEDGPVPHPVPFGLGRIRGSLEGLDDPVGDGWLTELPGGDLWRPGAEYIDAEARHPSVPSKLARRIDHRGLPAHKIGGFWKVKPSESDDWLRAGGAEAPEEGSGR